MKKHLVKYLLVFIAFTMASRGFPQTGVKIDFKPMATQYNVTGGGHYCAGNNGVAVGLSGSQTGVEYQNWFNVTTSIGLPKPGTGTSIPWGNQTLPGTYTIISHDLTTGCYLPMAGSATIVVDPLPSDSIAVTSGSANVCAPNTVSMKCFTNAALPTYQWQLNSNDILGATLSTYTATVTGLYTCKVTDGNSCSNIANQMVNIYPLPTATATALPDSICPGGSSVLTAGGGVSYLWSTNATTAAISVSPTVTSSYNVTVTNSNGCTQATSVIVTVNPVPSAFITPASAAICPNGSANLIASGGTGYVWSTTATTNSITVSPASSTTYTVTVSNAFGCTASRNATVTVNPSPSASITPSSSTICNGDAVTLHGHGASGTNYQWSTGINNIDTIIVAPTTTTVYSVTVTNSYSCTASSNAVITVNQLPTAFNVGATSNSFCQGGLGDTITLSGSEIGVSYQVKNSLGNNFGLPQNGLGIALKFTGINVVGTYTIEATNLASCKKQMNGSVTITMDPLPSAAGTITGPTSVCEGTTVTYSISSIANATSYVWSVPLGAAIQSTTGTSISVKMGSSSGSVSVFGKNDCGGGTSSSLSVTVLAAPVVVITTGDNELCVGENTNLTASGNGTSFAWSNGAGSTQMVNVAPVTTTTYVVTATGANGCSATDDMSVTVHALPNVTLTLTQDHFCPDDAPTVLSGGSPLGGIYSGSCVVGVNTVVPSSTSPSTYTITYTYTDGNNCTSSAQDLAAFNPTPAVTFNSITGAINTSTPSFDLMMFVSPIGGVFTGPGTTTGSSMFDPALAGPGVHQVFYEYTHPITFCSAKQSQYITVTSSGNGIDEVTSAVDLITLYPNPATDQLNLANINTKEIKSLKIMSLIGALVYATEIDMASMTINTSEYPAGVYIISFIDADGFSVSKRFVKNGGWYDIV